MAGLLCVAPGLAQALGEITHVALRVSNLERSEEFYRRLGFEQAFVFRDGGKISVDFLKINDRQFIELYPSAGRPGLSHICFETAALADLRAGYVARGLKPTPAVKARAGNLLSSLTGPDGQVLEFLQYLPGSLHVADRGKHLGAGRISQRLARAELAVTNLTAARDFFRTGLGVEPLAAGVDLNPAPKAPPARLVFATDDLVRTVIMLKQRGFQVATSPSAAWVTDPDGAAIVFNPYVEYDWTRVADQLISTPVDSYPFNWGEGVQMMGLMRAAAVAGDPRYFDYVERWARIWESKNLATLLNAGPPPYAFGRPGYCGFWSPASAILYLYGERRRPEHLQLARDVVQFIRTRAERSPEGGLGHWQGSHQLWVDTLYMACPLLARLGKLENRPELIEDAANQLIVHARHAQDARTGLFSHMWDWQTGTVSEGAWARGNGWVLMSLAETLETMDGTHPRYAELVALARKVAAAAESTQDADGMWHTVMDDRSTYAEASATAMFAYGLLKLARLKALPESAAVPALRAWRAVNQRYVADGRVVGVSAGTDPKGKDAYKQIRLGSQTWGTGAYLLAASEISRRDKMATATSKLPDEMGIR